MDKPQFIIDLEFWQDCKSIVGHDAVELVKEAIDNAQANGEQVLVDWEVLQAWRK